MNVLVACEESQRVCIAFRKRGFEAYSCDIQEPSGGHPEWHIMDNVLNIINPRQISNSFYGIVFKTMDGAAHKVKGKWDLIIAHPPCTYLSNAGACRLYPQKGILDLLRYSKGVNARTFFMHFINADCEHIAVENPIPSKVFELPRYTQIIQPYEYGHPYSKKTCLWLRELPKLKPTKILTVYKPYVSCGTSKNKGNPDKAGVSRAGGDKLIRSKTFEGIAAAMAQQWGDYLLEVSK